MLHLIVPWSRPGMRERVERNIDTVRGGTREPTTVTLVRVGHREPSRLPTLDVEACNAAQARNHGLEHLLRQDLSGPVAFLDDDDEFGPGFLERCLAALSLHPKCEWVSGWIGLVHVIETDDVFCIDPQLSDMPAPSALGGCLMHRELRRCPMFSADFGVGEDTEWGWRAGPGWRMSVGQFMYSVHGGQTTRMPWQVLVNSATELFYLGKRSNLHDFPWVSPVSRRAVRLQPVQQVVFDWMRSQVKCLTQSSAST